MCNQSKNKWSLQLPNRKLTTFCYKYEMVQYMNEKENMSAQSIADYLDMNYSAVMQLLHYKKKSKSRFSLSKSEARLKKSINGLTYSHVEYYSVYLGTQEIRFMKDAFDRIRVDNGVMIVE